MKLLTVCVLGWALMALTTAAGEKKDDQIKSDLVKRFLFCSSGWTKINGACFQYVPKRMTWATAEKNCLSTGSHLASVENLYEHQEIQKLTLDHGSKETWIGGLTQEENSWFWIDGEKFVYTDWCSGEPNNLNGSQHCLQMNHRENKCWDDVGCKSLRPSVCVKRGWGLVGGKSQ